MKQEPNIRIASYGNVTSGGLTLSFSKPVRVYTGAQYKQDQLKLNEWWVSWDKLSEMIAPYMDAINKED